MNIFALTFSFLVFISSAFAQESFLPVPRLTAPVVDQANVLKPSTRRSLDRFLKQVKKQWGTQLAVLIVPSLKGEPIENFSLRVVDQWKLGSAEQDDGVLLVIAQKDRRLRIEVGQGLEGRLTDSYSRRVIDEVIAPYFKKGQFDRGVMAGVMQILRYAHPDVNWQEVTSGALAGAGQVRELPSRKKKMGIFEIILFFIVLVMSIISPSFRTLLFMSLLSGGRGGFGGGRGGGFSGGGGGFSGGGSSGGW